MSPSSPFGDMNEMTTPPWGGEDRRAAPTFNKDGWTLWREIWGTFLGALPALLVAGGAVMQLYSLVQIHTVEINHLKEADTRHEAQLQLQRAELVSARAELGAKLDKIDQRIERLQEIVARDVGRTFPNRSLRSE